MKDIDFIEPSEKRPPASPGILRSQPPQYVTLTAGSQQPEPLRANSDEEALETVRRRCRSGQMPAIYLFKMIGAEVFEPSSRSLTVEEVMAGKAYLEE